MHHGSMTSVRVHVHVLYMCMHGNYMYIIHVHAVQYMHITLALLLRSCRWWHFDFWRISKKNDGQQQLQRWLQRGWGNFILWRRRSKRFDSLVVTLSPQTAMKLAMASRSAVPSLTGSNRWGAQLGTTPRHKPLGEKTTRIEIGSWTQTGKENLL